VSRAGCRAQPKRAIAGLTKLVNRHDVPAVAACGSSFAVALATLVERNPRAGMLE
jgi:hypothetical protein